MAERTSFGRLGASVPFPLPLPSSAPVALMNQVLRIDNADPLIVYDSSWKIILNSGDGRDGSYSLATTPAAQFFFQFRGTVLRA
jgi:hypothetical protein